MYVASLGKAQDTQSDGPIPESERPDVDDVERPDAPWADDDDGGGGSGGSNGGGGSGGSNGDAGLSPEERKLLREGGGIVDPRKLREMERKQRQQKRSPAPRPRGPASDGGVTVPVWALVGGGVAVVMVVGYLVFGRS